jgi:hypothetical protein
MTNPNKDTKKTITELKKVAGGATGPSYESAGPSGSDVLPSVDIERNVQHVTNLGIELSNVAAAAAAPSPATKSDGPQLPQAPQKKLTPSSLDMADLENAAAGATAQSFGSIGDSSPQIPEVFPPPTARRIQGQSPSMQQLQNVVAGATAPGANISGSGPALPNKPQMNIGANATPVAVGDLSNVAAGATAPGANIGDVGPATPNKPTFQIGPGSVPVQTGNADVT